MQPMSYRFNNLCVVAGRM